MSATTAYVLRWVGMPTFLAAATIGAPLTAVALPFAMLPTLGLLYQRQTLPKDRQADITALTYVYFGSATLGMVAVLAGQALLLKAILKPLFGEQADGYVAEFMRSSIKDLTPEQLAYRAKLASSWRNYAFLLAFTFIGAGGLEELLKYAPIVLLRRQRQRSGDKRPIPKEVLVQYAVTAALGFSTLENIAYSRMAVKAGERGWKLALTIFERTIAGGPGHCLTAALVAINAARLGDYRTTPSSLWSILSGPIAWHGAFDFMLFAVSSLHGNVGFIHPDNPWTVAGVLLLAESIQFALFMHVGRAWRGLGE